MASLSIVMAPRLLSWNQQVSLVQAGVIVLAMLFLICANAAALLFLQSYEAGGIARVADTVLHSAAAVVQ